MECALISKAQIETEKLNAIAPFGPLPNGRKRLCGAWTLQGSRLGSGNSLHGFRNARGTPSRKFVRLRCKCWSCSLCGPRKACKYRGQIVRAVVRYRLNRMVTLTLDVRKIASGEELRTYFVHFEAHKPLGTACRCATCEGIQIRSIAHIRKCWSKLRVYLLRRYGVAPRFVAVLEFQKVTGLAHLHIAIDRFIDQGWAQEAWQGVGGGQHVDIRYKDAHRAGAYISKYFSKDMLLSAPVGMRRVTTSRSIKLNEKKPSEFDWKVIKGPIDRFYVELHLIAIDEMRSDGELESFSVRE